MHYRCLRLLTLALALLLCTCVRAQSGTSDGKWQAGYYLDVNGNRINGQIKYNSSNEKFRNFTYRATPDAEPQTVKLSDVQLVEFDEYRFVSHEVTFNDDPRKISDLITTAASEIITERGGLRVYYEGPVSLYGYISDSGQPHYFVRKNDGPVTNLPYGLRQERGNDGGEGRVIYDNSWRSLLAKSFLEDCAGNEQKIRNAGYTRIDLMRLFDQYYDCTGQTPDYSVKRQKSSLQLIPTVGAIYTTHDMVDQGGIGWENPTTLAPAGGIQLWFRAPAESALTLKVGTFFHKATFTSEGPRPRNTTIDLRRNYEYAETTLTTDLGGSLRVLSLGELKLAVDLGIRHEVQFKMSEFYTQDPSPGFPRLTIDYEYKNFTRINSYVGLTAEIDKFKLSLRANRQRNRYRPTGPDFMADVEDYIVRFAVLAGYSLLGK